MSSDSIAAEATKSAPVLTVSALNLLGVPLSTWVLVLTFVYTVLQLYFLIRDKWWRDRERKKDSNEFKS